MTNYVLLGGNGYLGRNFTNYALKQDPTAKFYVVSRSGKNKLQNAAITNIQADVTDEKEAMAKLPDKFDYIIDFIGAPAKTAEQSKQINDLPAYTMKKIAEEKHVKAMGFIGGILGAKDFVQTKKSLIKELKQSSIPLAYVEPTLVIGEGRKDNMTKMVPMLNFLGIFSKKFKPVEVDEVVASLYQKLVNAHAA